MNLYAGCFVVVSLLLVHVQNQQLTKLMVPGEVPPCQTSRRSLSPFPGSHGIASGARHSLSQFHSTCCSSQCHSDLTNSWEWSGQSAQLLEMATYCKPSFFSLLLLLTPSTSKMLDTIKLEAPAFQTLLHGHPSPTASWFSGQ